MMSAGTHTASSSGANWRSLAFTSALSFTPWTT
jgi:hypothetical protein